MAHISYKVLESMQRRFPARDERPRNRGLARLVKPFVPGINEPRSDPESGKEAHDV